MSRALIVIPARHASSRLPGKPLLAETGKPMIVHVCERAAEVQGARVLVATDDERIAQAARAAGFEAAMTDPEHQTGTARVAEAAGGTKARIVVNLQGDEPEVEPEAIATLIDLHETALAETDAPLMSTLASPFRQGDDPSDPSSVKAVLSPPREGGTRRALWFSRARVPYPRAGEASAAPLLHVGLYAFTPPGLALYAALTPTPMERTESLEQLRVLEHGYGIAAAVVPPAAPGIDTPEDYARFVARWRTGS